VNHYSAVFISDLHLHPEDKAITARWEKFLHWAPLNTQAIYILGDFLHVWAGDDAMTPWSHGIAKQLAELANHGIVIYWMPGNRDFLLGKKFCALAKITRIPDPYVLSLGQESILLTHGDSYCTKDKGHQWLRRLTRNRVFITAFLHLPLVWRRRLVQKVRTYSSQNRQKPRASLTIVAEVMLRQMAKQHTQIVIHGHIHQPGCIAHGEYLQYVLSDWDDIPAILCYDYTKGFFFILCK
jgi:UDP-2,3-diacylglucosamine hydrolase